MKLSKQINPYSFIIIAIFLLLTASTPAFAAESESKYQWKFGAEVYLWGASIGGETATGEDLDISFTDLVEDLEFGFMGAAWVRNGKWSLLGDVIFLDVSDEERFNANLVGNPINTRVDVELKGWVINILGGYTAINTEKFMLNVVAGARYLYLDTDLKFDINDIKDSFSGSGHIWDGIIGVKGQANISEKWYISYYLDVGTGDTEFTWQALGGLGYKFKKLDAVFGYRYLDWNFDDDDPGGKTFDDLNFHGPYVGVKFAF